MSNLKAAYAVLASGVSRGSAGVGGGGGRRVPVSVLDGVEGVAAGDVEAVLALMLAIKRGYTLVSVSPHTGAGAGVDAGAGVVAVSSMGGSGSAMGGASVVPVER